MISQGSVTIECPIEDVFQVTTQRVVEWSTIVVEDEVIEETPDVVGTTFRTVTIDRGQRMEFEGVVTKNDPPTLHTVQLTGKQFVIEAEYTFERISHKATVVTQRSTVAGKGLFKLILLLTGWMMRSSSCKATQKELDNLKQLCEAVTPSGARLE